VPGCKSRPIKGHGCLCPAAAAFKTQGAQNARPARKSRTKDAAFANW
jgi:hypothetical protein